MGLDLGQEGMALENKLKTMIRSDFKAVIRENLPSSQDILRYLKEIDLDPILISPKARHYLATSVADPVPDTVPGPPGSETFNLSGSISGSVIT